MLLKGPLFVHIVRWKQDVRILCDSDSGAEEMMFRKADVLTEESMLRRNGTSLAPLRCLCLGNACTAYLSFAGSSKRLL